MKGGNIPIGGPPGGGLLAGLAGLFLGMGVNKAVDYLFSELLKKPKNSEYRSRVPLQYWYDPVADRVVLDDVPPNEKSVPLLCKYVSGESCVNLDELREEYIRQERDAFNPNYRKDAGTYNTSQKRNERQRFYDNQKPTMSLKKLHRNMSTLNNQDPNGFNSMAGSAGRRTPSWLPVVTPDNFKYTTVITTNYARQGLLHALIRHGDQFAQNGLSSDISTVLPQPMRDLVAQLRNANDFDANNNFTLGMQTMDDDDFKKLLNLQLEAHRLIQGYVTRDNYLGESTTTNGQQQVHFRVDRSTVMVLALSEELLIGEEHCDTKRRKRPIRKIITVFFTKMEDFDTKKRNKWPISKNQ